MPTRKEPKPKEDATKTLSDKKIQEYIDGIYDGSVTKDNLSETVYHAIVKYLKDGLYTGFGMNLNEAEGKDLDLLTELRENVYMFGAAKDYQMTKDISSLLIDEDGNRRTNKEFNEIARDTYDNWNDNWGETEYSTAIGQGYAAQQWNEIEKNKDILPNLTYSAIGDACDICQPLDGITAPVDDPIWNKISPLNHFNCKCILEQHDEEAETTDTEEKDKLYDNAIEKMDPVFASNPGKDGMVFNENHPYFDVAKEDREFAKSNFGMPIPEKD